MDAAIIAFLTVPVSHCHFSYLLYRSSRWIQ